MHTVTVTLSPSVPTVNYLNYRVKVKRSKSKIENFLVNTHSTGSIIWPPYEYIVVPIAQWIAVHCCWINAGRLMCVTIWNFKFIPFQPFVKYGSDYSKTSMCEFYLHTVCIDLSSKWKRIRTNCNQIYMDLSAVSSY